MREWKINVGFGRTTANGEVNIGTRSERNIKTKIIITIKIVLTRGYIRKEPFGVYIKAPDDPCGGVRMAIIGIYFPLRFSS